MSLFKVSKKPKKIAMLFSGGLDSTFLMYKNLKEGHKVHPFYIEISNNVDKIKIEKQQFLRLYHEFKKEFDNNYRYNIEDPYIITKIQIFQTYDSQLMFTQIPLWLFSILYMSHNFDEIQIGYVANDDAISYIKEIEKTYYSMGWMVHGKLPKLTFPILKHKKITMYEALPEQYKKLVFSCEAPLIHDEMTDLNSDEIKFYERYSLNKFLNESKKYYTYDPCGECDTCRKILNTPDLINLYMEYQPVFKKLKTNQILNQHKILMRNLEYDNDVKQQVEKWEERDIAMRGGYVHDSEYVEKKYDDVDIVAKPINELLENESDKQNYDQSN